MCVCGGGEWRGTSSCEWGEGAAAEGKPQQRGYKVVWNSEFKVSGTAFFFGPRAERPHGRTYIVRYGLARDASGQG